MSCGPGIAADTTVPTPTGWTTAGSLNIGDEIFGSDGQPCRAVAKSIVAADSFVVKFDDKSEATCARGQPWRCLTGQKADKRIVISAEDASLHLRRPGFRSSNHGLRILLAAPLSLPAAKLPVDPYLLGTWLGDGDSVRGVITQGDDDLFDILRSDGHALGKLLIDPRSNVRQHTVLGLSPALRELGLLRNKHVPGAYLRANYSQRLALVRGLMDTDGTWNIARNAAVFSNTSKPLTYAMRELLLSLGQRPRVNEFLARGFGKESISHYVEFTPLDIVPFRLPRKAGKCLLGIEAKVNDVRSRRRLIKSIEPIPSMLVARIKTDAPDGTYLCTDRMIPVLGADPAILNESNPS